MGNGTSQSIVLGAPRFQASAYPPRNNGYYDNRGVPKYVHPHNRVLPKPVAGQRLRSTDNGSILQTAGTIRGQRRGSTGKEDNTDPEVMGILRRRSEMIEKENDCYHHLNLRNHRLFHSDPNIARRPTSNGYDDDPPEMYANRRSCGGGVAVRTSKLKYKKKARAPDPPPSGSSLPRQLERRPQTNSVDVNKRNMACKCIVKSRAPQPPDIVVHPPPPPPMPNYLTTRTMVSSPQHSKSQSELSSSSPSVTRAVASKDGRLGYEKNVHPLEKWRNCRSTGDVRLDEEDECSPSRTTVFDSRKISESQTKLPSYLPQRPDPFQKEIQAVTKKIAESRQGCNAPQTPRKESPLPSTSKTTPNSKSKETSSPPKFYFSDVGIFKMGNQKADSSTVEDNKDLGKRPNPERASRTNVNRVEDHRPQSPRRDTMTIDEIVPSLQRFSPGRRRFKTPSRSPTPNQNGEEKEWDRLAKNLQPKSIESDIDLRLRPVLPRKPAEVPKFSASDAWQALGSDGLGSSNHSTSDDGRECSSPYKKNGFVSRNLQNDRSRRQSDIEINRYQNASNGFKHRSLSDSHWTPRQDLLDDSDVSSEDSEDAVVPRIHPELNEISPRFSLPTVMFSNMRPIGSEIKSNTTQQTNYINSNSRYTQSSSKKKATKQSSNELAPTFKRFLSKRNKYMSEEDIAASDSNWTFGQYGLQKRGKQYSSDLMLSEKKKYELMSENNFSDFLGDILMSKADHMRKQMKSSDSGNSNFSFYSTEGQITFMPEKGGFIKEEEYIPQSKGRVYDMRRKFDGNFEAKRTSFIPKSSKKKGSTNGIEMGRKRDLELAKMLEDEVRKRRNKEKITIRQQLQRIKNFQSDVEDDEDDDFDDEAYFTEPKSREDSQSPFFSSDLVNHPATSELGIRPFRLQPGTSNEPQRLSHWQSSPALLEDSVMKIGMRPTNKGRLSMSSVMSSPDPEVWTQSRAVDTWLTRQGRNLDSPPRPSKALDHSGLLTTTDHANDGDVSSSPTPAPPKKERRKTNIYKQLMDIVRKEERHLKNAQKNGVDPNSRDSSYSQRESSPSTCSESSSTSSYSYSDSSSARNQAINGVPANKEFHSSGYTRPPSGGAPSFQVSFVQPYSPSKSYRPVPFDIVHSSSNNYRMPGLQEEGKHLQAKVS